MLYGKLFALAGFWEVWQPPQENCQGQEIKSCTILTTAANELVQPIHHRMPVILAPEDDDLCLNPQMAIPPNTRAAIVSISSSSNDWLPS
jgi:putative SOS response-associated peptidase YedK